MIKTLRITSVIAVLMAMAIFALPIKYGVKTDQNVENFLNGPQVTEIFKATLGSRPKTPVNQVHPLVLQAEALKNILNPPKPVVASDTRQPDSARTIIKLSPTVTPKFNLISTIYYPLDPEMSRALIEEGKKRYWVKQSTEVNHLLIEQVKDGMVIVRNGDETFELKTPEKNIKNPVLITPTSGRITGTPSSSSRSTPTRSTTGGSSPVRPPRTPPVSSTKTTVTPKTTSGNESRENVEDLIDKIKMLSEDNSNPDGSPLTMEEKAVQMQKLLDEFRKTKMNINDEESQKLDELGDYLEYLQDTSLEN